MAGRTSAQLAEEARRINPAPHRSRRGDELGGSAVRGAPLSASSITQLQRAAGNRAVGQLVAQRALVVQRDDYPYGSANTTPHIHRYGGDSHLKILEGSKIKRLNLVQDGVRYPDRVNEAFDYARSTGNTALVNAIKVCIAGAGRFGLPGSKQK